MEIEQEQNESEERGSSQKGRRQKGRRITEGEEVKYDHERGEHNSNSKEAKRSITRIMGCEARTGPGLGQEAIGEGCEAGEEVRMKQAGKISPRGKWTRVVVGFNRGSDQQRSCEHRRRSILSNAVYGGQERQQYHLSTDVSKSALRGVLFQLVNQLPGTVSSPKNRKDQPIIMFISKPVTGAEMRDSTMEREALAVVRCLVEVLWLVLGSAFPTKVYTDDQAIVRLPKDNARGRIAW